jgi:hypothetical protein
MYDLVSLFRRYEQEMFPEMRHPKKNLMKGAFMQFEQYVFFLPSYHAESGLITIEMIQALRKGGRLLDVGTGPGYLPQILAEKFGIEKENITLTDFDCPYSPDGFKKYNFDMLEAWPDFQTGFDYILFPRSIFLPERLKDLSLASILAEALSRINQGGEVRYNSPIPYRGAYDELLECFPDLKVRQDSESFVFYFGAR